MAISRALAQFRWAKSPTSTGFVCVADGVSRLEFPPLLLEQAFEVIRTADGESTRSVEWVVVPFADELTAELKR